MAKKKTPAYIQDPTGVLPLEGQTWLAEQFAAYSNRRHIYVHGIGWHYWTGTHWKQDVGDANTRRRLLKLIKFQWSRAFSDPTLLAKLQGCMSNQAQTGTLKIAAIMEQFSVTVDQLDANPYDLNCANGTLNLLTGELRPHDPGDLITKITRGAYGSTTGKAEWDTFIERVLPDPEVRAYLQRVTGLGLVGNSNEHILPIATGTAQNGKGTYYNAVLHALGDYGHMAESDLFMKAKTNANSASPALFSLRGARFVICSETERGAPIAEALMKFLTGGDLITARALHQMPVEFAPTHNALMVTNHLPRITSNNDDAIWRRMRVIPFSVTIPEEERDPKLGERLKLSADAILTWAYEGYRQYEESGMNPPAAVSIATEKYRADSDDFGRFIRSKIDTSDATARTLRGTLWNAWQEWCRAEDVPVGSQGDFYREMEKNYSTKKSNGARYFVGIQIENDSEDLDVFLDEEAVA